MYQATVHCTVGTIDRKLNEKFKLYRFVIYVHVTVLFKKFKKVILTFFCFSASAEQRMEAAIADTVAGVGKAKNIFTKEDKPKKPCVGKVTFLLGF